MVEPGRPVLRIWRPANDRERRERDGSRGIACRAGALHPPGRQGEGDGYAAAIRPTSRWPGSCTRSSATPTTRTRGSCGSTPRRRGRCPACSPSSPMRTSPTSSTAAWSRTDGCSRGTTVRFEGDIVAGVAATTAEIAEQRSRADRGRVRAAARRHATTRRRSPTVRRSSTPSGSATRATRRSAAIGNTLGYSTIVKGDAAAALAEADVVVKGRYVTDPVQGVPIEPRAIIAQWQGDRSPSGHRPRCRTPRAAGVAHDAADSRVARPRDRAAARRRLRRQVRLPLRGPRRRARARRRSAP